MFRIRNKENASYIVTFYDFIILYDWDPKKRKLGGERETAVVLKLA